MRAETPLATRHRITRKELKQPDEFQTVFETAALFFELHMREVLLAAVALIAIAAIVLGLYYYEASRARAAAARFDQALNELQGGEYTAAEQHFASLAGAEPHRAVGRLANLYLADAFLAQNQPAKARDALQRFLASGGPPLFRDAALNDLAVAYEDLGDYKQAESAYRQASDIAGPDQVRAELGVARMLQKQGRKTDAIAAYRDFLRLHPYAPERTLAMGAMAQLGVAPDTVPAIPPTVKLIKPAAAQ